MELNKDNLNEYYNDEEIFIIPNKFTSIGDYCFYGCESLEEITIPNSITSLGDGCFYGCKSLEKIIIPNSVIIIGHGCFYWCESLEEIIIPNNPSMDLLKELINRDDLDLSIIHTVNNVDIKDKINFIKMYM